MTDQPAARPPARQPETMAITAGRAGQRRRRWRPPLWATSTFETDDVEESLRLATTPKARSSTAATATRRSSAFEDAVAAARGRRGGAGVRARAWAPSARVVLAMCSTGDHIVAQRQLFSTTQLLFARRAAPLRHRRRPSSTAPTPSAIAAAVRPARRADLRRDAGQPAAAARRPRRGRRDHGPAQGGRLDLRRAAHPAPARARLRPRDALGHEEHRRPQRRHPRRGRRRATTSSSGSGATTRSTARRASPFDALNGLRGIRTLGVRIRQQSASRPSGSPSSSRSTRRSQRVNYPGLDSHPQRELAKRQMALGGGVLSFDVAGGWEAGRRVRRGAASSPTSPRPSAGPRRW